MKNIFILLFLSIAVLASSQAITEEQFTIMVESAQEQCVGAHENYVRQTNEGFANQSGVKRSDLTKQKLSSSSTNLPEKKYRRGLIFI